MDLKQLEALVRVIDSRSFSKAAAQLHLTQPTVSAHIAALEQECGIRLLVRGAKQVLPTPAGKLLYEYALEMLLLRREACSRLANFEKEQKGELVIAASTIPYLYYLPQLVARFQEQYPDIHCNLLRCGSTKVVNALVANQAEIGFTGTQVDSSKCLFEPFAMDRLIVITPPNERFQSYVGRGFPLARLPKENFINREAGSGTRKESEFFIKEMGINPATLKVVAELDSTEKIKEWVAAGRGIAILSARAAAAEIRAGKLLGFDFEGMRLNRKLFIVRHRIFPLSPLARRFYAFAIDYYHESQ